MNNPVLYVLINKELKMSAGKAAAQAVHAAMIIARGYHDFTDSYKRTVIVLEAENTNQLKNLHEYLLNAGLVSVYYLDEGVNEVGAYSLTALAVEPIEADDFEKREIFKPFNLFDIYEEHEEEFHTTNEFREALKYLRSINDGCIMHSGRNAPWYVQKTIKWLEKRK